MPIGQQFSDFQQQTPQACVVDLVPPSGGAISSITNNPDGSVKIQWPAASDTNAPITYEVYVQKGTATGLFSTTPFLARGLSLDVYRDSLGAMIVQGETIHAAVRAVDALGNQNTNTTTMSVVAAGIGYANLLSVLPGAVWDRPLASHVAAGTFGKEVQDIDTAAAAIKAKTDLLTFTGANLNAIANVVADKTGYALTPAERTAIAAVVEAALINDGDGQALINAIVTSIGNTNVNEVALIAAIRADLERSGGLIDTRATQASVNLVKAKTDNLPSDPASQSALATLIGALESDSAALARATAILAAIAAIPNAPSAGVIADAVWDEATSGHTSSGTFGLNAQTPSINAAQVAQAVWNALTADYTLAGSFGLNAQNPPLSATQIANAVWDALVADHNAANTFGANAQTPSVNPSQIADAVWDAPLGDHLDVGSTGKKLSDGLTAASFIPAGQQVEVEFEASGVEIEVNPKQEINIEIGEI